jgi:outer membrane protein OmpA-like peptidoglycan-associated protein
MKLTLASLFLSTAITMNPTPADACGVKLTVKSTPPRKAINHTSNPSDILILGDPPSRFKRDLSAEGHRVDIASTPADAKKKTYAVVVTEPGMQQVARLNFTNSLIVVRSGDEDADIISIENSIARRPVNSDQGRAVVAAREARQPIAAGPTTVPDRQLISARPVEATTPTVSTDVAPAKPAVKPAAKVEAKVEAPKPVPAETKTVEARVTKEVAPPAESKTPAEPTAAVKSGTVMIEVYFSVGDSKIARLASLDVAVRKLKADPSLSILIEGHADPSGTPEGNLELSQKRAEIARDYLVSNGIAASRLEVTPLGDTHLRYGRADNRNRRVAIVAK